MPSATIAVAAQGFKGTPSSSPTDIARAPTFGHMWLSARSVSDDHPSGAGRVGVAPRIFLKKLVGDVLDRVDQFGDFDPRRDYALTLADAELTAAEREGRPAAGVDDVELAL